MQINIQRLKALIRKETIRLLRDRRLLLFVLGMPILQLFFYGYAASLSVDHLPTVIVDQSNDPQSRQFIQELVNSQYFNVTLSQNSESEAIHAIERGEVKIGVILPPRFASNMEKGNASILFLFDGSDNASVQSGYAAAALVTQNHAFQMITKELFRNGQSSTVSTLPIATSINILYNPNMINIWFILPGLVGLVLQTMAITQAVLIVVSERELGTIEPILSTPARPIEIILSKMVPLLTLCLLAMSIVVGIGVFWFGVPFRGDLITYFCLSLLFIVSSLGLGLLLSTRASTQMEASQYGMTFMLVGILMSGFMYPSDNMPVPLQIIGSLIPATYFIRISRSIFLKGVGMTFIWSDALVLVIYVVVITLIVSRNYKQRLD
jgi:ABC-2 type transport system permease protein